jgi:hypothetical protein
MAEPQEYPNDGDQVSGDLGGAWYPKSNDSQQRQLEGAIEKHKFATSYPILDDLVEWFDEWIVEAGNIENIEIKEMKIGGFSHKRNVSIEGQVLAMKLLKERLEAKRNEFKNWKDQLDDTGR